jgi:hypothetical protein
MNRPPVLMHLRFRNEEHNFGLWLPLFLLLPLLLVVLIVLSPLILIAVLALWPFGWGRWGLVALAAAVRSLFALRGLEVDVRSGQEHVLISVI